MCTGTKQRVRIQYDANVDVDYTIILVNLNRNIGDAKNASAEIYEVVCVVMPATIYCCRKYLQKC